MEKKKSDSSHIKTVIRTIFYQFLLVFIGLSIGFIIAPNYWGNKAPIIERSVNHIFFPLEYNDQLELSLMDFGKFRLWTELDFPTGLTCFNSRIINEEWYETDYSFTDKDQKIVEGTYTTRIKWKPWELYYTTPEDMEKNFLE